MPKMSSGNKKNAVYACDFMGRGAKERRKRRSEESRASKSKRQAKENIKCFIHSMAFFMLKLKHSDHDSSHNITNKTMLHRLVAFCLFGEALTHTNHLPRCEPYNLFNFDPNRHISDFFAFPRVLLQLQKHVEAS
jgi:sugar (pentulose or hexulose) kinase